MNEPKNGNRKLTIASPGDLASAIPFMLGFHPQESLVIVGKSAHAGTLAARLDLAGVPEGCSIQARILRKYGCKEILLAGYGPDDQVAPAVAAARDIFTSHGLTIRESLRISGGRYWSYTCADPQCCSPDGVSFDASTSQVAAAAVYAGLVALPSRDHMVASLAPVAGDARARMAEATEKAKRRFARGLASTGKSAMPQRLIIENLARIPQVAAQAKAGKTLSDEETAELGILLTALRLRDEMWLRINSDAADEAAMRHHLEFWCDILRRVERRYTPAPACLLAYTAYMRGNGALANAAVNRALDVDPTYRLAFLLRSTLNTGVPPHEIRAVLASGQDEQPE